MADELAFNQGKDAILANGGGLTTSVSFALSTKKVGTQQAGEHIVTDTYAGGFGEITGTGYARITVNPRPAAVNGVVTFAQIVWDVGVNTNWQSPKSVVMVDSNSKLISAINLVTGGAAQDMSGALSTLAWTGTWFLQNVGGG